MAGCDGRAAGRAVELEGAAETAQPLLETGETVPGDGCRTSVAVVGNGDIRSLADAEAMTAATGCAAVMVGRGALGAPWIFRGAEISRDERARVIRRHEALIEALLPPRTAAIQLKRHLAWYASGFPGAARLRVEIFGARDSARAREIFWSAW